MTQPKDNVDDAHISIRFKHGIHTIFLLVDPLKPFSNITDELMNVLRSRYPNGLTACAMPFQNTEIPETMNDSHVCYGTMVDVNDNIKGWRNLKIRDRDTPASKGLKDGSVLAFAFASDEEDPEFVVEWPKLDDEEDDDDDGEMAGEFEDED